ncbi:hypothetical protein Tco_0152819 [Tanacetum coccineum]
MAFNPRKSLDYKVVQVATHPNLTLKFKFTLQIFKDWQLEHVDGPVNLLQFCSYCSEIYWNDAFHWLERNNRQLTLYKLNTKEDHDHPIISTIKIPHELQWEMNFLQYFGGSIGSDNPMLVPRVNTFVDMNTELVKSSETRTEGSSKRAGDELESDNLKKQ